MLKQKFYFILLSLNWMTQCKAHMLNLQLVIRQVGIYSSPFLYQFHK